VRPFADYERFCVRLHAVQVAAAAAQEQGDTRCARRYRLQIAELALKFASGAVRGTLLSLLGRRTVTFLPYLLGERSDADGAHELPPLGRVVPMAGLELLEEAHHPHHAQLSPESFDAGAADLFQGRRCRIDHRRNSLLAYVTESPLPSGVDSHTSRVTRAAATGAIVAATALPQHAMGCSPPAGAAPRRTLIRAERSGNVVVELRSNSVAHLPDLGHDRVVPRLLTWGFVLLAVILVSSQLQKLQNPSGRGSAGARGP